METTKYLYRQVTLKIMKIYHLRSDNYLVDVCILARAENAFSVTFLISIPLTIMRVKHSKAGCSEIISPTI